MTLRLKEYAIPGGLLAGFDMAGQLRLTEPNDADAGHTVNQKGSGRLAEWQAAGVVKSYVANNGTFTGPVDATGVTLTGDLLPNAPDARSIGSVAKELLNIYLGDAGRLYLGLAQDISIYRNALNEATIVASAGLHVPTNVTGDTFLGPNVGVKIVLGTGSGYMDLHTTGSRPFQFHGAGTTGMVVFDSANSKANAIALGTEAAEAIRYWSQGADILAVETRNTTDAMIVVQRVATASLRARNVLASSDPRIDLIAAGAMTLVGHAGGDIIVQPDATKKLDVRGSVLLGLAASSLGFFGTAPAARQGVAALTNNVTAGGVADTIANFVDLAVYANDAATIRNDIYQLALKLGQVVTALRLHGLFS